MMTEPYIAGVRRGIDADTIKFYPPYLKETLGPADKHSHLPEKQRADEGHGKLSSSNMRNLDESAMHILKRMTRDVTEKMNLLFLGPGGGKETADARRIAPNANIETIACTPMNPEIHFKKTVDEISTECTGTSAGLGNLSIPDYILAAQEHQGFDWLKRDKKNPVVDLQRIGLIRDILPTLENDKYRFIYEYYGPIHYSFDSANTDQHLPSHAAEDEFMEKIQNILTPDGVMMLVRAQCRTQMCLQQTRSNKDVLLFHSQGGPTIYAKEESHIAHKLQKRNMGDGGTFEMDFLEFEAFFACL